MAGIMSKTYYVVVRVPCKIIGAEKFSEDTTVNIFRSQEMAVECLHKIMSSTKPEDDEFTLDHFSEGDVMSQLWSFDEDVWLIKSKIDKDLEGADNKVNVILLQNPDHEPEVFLFSTKDATQKRLVSLINELGGEEEECKEIGETRQYFYVEDMDIEITVFSFDLNQTEKLDLAD